jgi:methyl-accepting chemotaxis protein
MNSPLFAKSAAPWSLRRWLLTCLSAMAAVVLVLATLVTATELRANQSRAASALALQAQVHLERHLRGLNEAVLSDGSSTARALATASAAELGRVLQALQAHTQAHSYSEALQQQVLPAWQQVMKASQALLAIQGLSASEDASMLAYGKVAGMTEALVQGVNLIEAQAAAAATQAESRLSWLAGGAAALGLLALAGLGAMVWHVVFARLGGEPALACELARRLATYDLSTPFPPLGPAQAGTVMAALASIRDSLVSVVGQVRHNAESVATASAQIASGNTDLNGRTGQQSQLLGGAAAAMVTLGQTVQHNADHAEHATELAARAAQVAAKGGVVVGQVVQTMSGINDSSRRIADILGVIDGIAFQTNILALNAAVEAARAGEQGRGFAVVASEVRNLASRSAAAAREIKDLISASVQRVGDGTALVDEAGATMGEIVLAIGQVSGIMDEIRQASRAQRDGVGEVGQAVQAMDRATQQNAALVEQSAAAADSLRQQAEQLVGAVAVFKLAH